MSPREELIQKIRAAIKGKKKVSGRSILNQYAIGRWVPVEERLPEFDTDGHWHGITRDTDGDVHACLCLKGIPLSNTATHWLELDLPETEVGQ